MVLAQQVSIDLISQGTHRFGSLAGNEILFLHNPGTLLIGQMEVSSLPLVQRYLKQGRSLVRKAFSGPR